MPMQNQQSDATARKTSALAQVSSHWNSIRKIVASTRNFTSQLTMKAFHQTVHRDDNLFGSDLPLGRTCLHRKQAGVLLEREGSRGSYRQQAGSLSRTELPHGVEYIPETHRCRGLPH